MPETDPLTPQLDPTPETASPAASDRQRRKRRVSRVRQAIEHGEYENALKVSVATDRLLQRLLLEQQRVERD